MSEFRLETSRLQLKITNFQLKKAAFQPPFSRFDA